MDYLGQHQSHASGMCTLPALPQHGSPGTSPDRTETGGGVHGTGKDKLVWGRRWEKALLQKGILQAQGWELALQQETALEAGLGLCLAV